MFFILQRFLKSTYGSSYQLYLKRFPSSSAVLTVLWFSVDDICKAWVWFQIPAGESPGDERDGGGESGHVSSAAQHIFHSGRLEDTLQWVINLRLGGPIHALLHLHLPLVVFRRCRLPHPPDQSPPNGQQEKVLPHAQQSTPQSEWPRPQRRLLHLAHYQVFPSSVGLV